ncbi:hypothetical protein WA026_016710, partial [Henosepilachna vigintioctopunctata]
DETDIKVSWRRRKMHNSERESIAENCFEPLYKKSSSPLEVMKIDEIGGPECVKPQPPKAQ